MSELREIVDAYRTLRRGGGRGILATVTRVAGSTYRRPGARMFAPEGGRAIGLISGGCLEGDVLERGEDVLATGEPRVVRYDTRSDDDIVWGLGLGCNGLVDVLIERLPGDAAPDPLDVVAECLEGGVAGALATVFGVESAQAGAGDTAETDTPSDRSAAAAGGVFVGDRFALHPDGSFSASRPGSPIETAVRADLRGALDGGRTRVALHEAEGARFEVLIEAVLPARPLLIVGAGPDAVPVARLGRALGCDVTVADWRPAFASESLFPDARTVLLCEPAELPARVPLDARGAALVMTHNYHRDLEALRALLPSPVGYVGLLGPRRRSERLLKDLAEEGATPSADQLARLHAPVGLDIGAETPDEIALSILAEMRAVLSGRSGGPLRDRAGPIHEPDAGPPDQGPPGARHRNK